MAAPCVLFASCSDKLPEELVKLVLGRDVLPNGVNVVEDITSYDWRIENKYYSSEVKLCTAKSRTIGNNDFADSVEAFVVHFDSKQVSSFDQMKTWLPYLTVLDPDILILVCDTCSNTQAVDKLTAQKFCIEHSFELVELSPEDTNSEDEEDDFQETTGIKRIVQALHAHTWPNLVMKDKPDIRSAYFRQLMQEELQSKSTNNSISNPSDEEFQDFVGCDSLVNSVNPNLISSNQTENETCSGATASSDNQAHSAPISGGCSNGPNIPIVSNLIKEGMKENDSKTKNESEEESTEYSNDSLLENDDMSLLAALGNENPGEESFEQLFEKLRTMKDRADGLPPEQRKDYAEQVAVSFWKAIGGDGAEIEGIDDSD